MCGTEIRSPGPRLNGSGGRGEHTDERLMRLETELAHLATREDLLEFQHKLEGAISKSAEEVSKRLNRTVVTVLVIVAGLATALIAAVFRLLP